MSGLAVLSGLTQGLGAGLDLKQRRKQMEADNARADALVAAYGRAPMGIPGYGGGGAPAESAGGTGTPGANYGAAGETSLLGVIDRTEGAGNYDTLFGHAQNNGRFGGVRVSQMTLGDLYRFSDPSGEYGQWVRANNPEGVTATPMGRFQIVGSTLRSAAREMGLPDDTVFNSGTQTAVAEHLARRRITGASSPAAKRAALRAEWAGFRHVPDATLDAAIAKFEANGNRFFPVPPRVAGMGVQ